MENCQKKLTWEEKNPIKNGVYVNIIFYLQSWSLVLERFYVTISAIDDGQFPLEPKLGILFIDYCELVTFSSKTDKRTDFLLFGWY